MLAVLDLTDWDLGIGVSALSYVDGVHLQNMDGLPDYRQAVGRGQMPILRAYRLGPREKVVRSLVLWLK